MGSTYDKIYAAAKRIPRGKVASYSQLALLAGNPRWSRVAGYAMSGCKDPGVPCHRVVYRDGRLSAAFGPMGTIEQETLLRAEGVGFLPDGRVDMDSYRWRPDE